MTANDEAAQNLLQLRRLTPPMDACNATVQGQFDDAEEDETATASVVKQRSPPVAFTPTTMLFGRGRGEVLVGQDWLGQVVPSRLVMARRPKAHSLVEQRKQEPSIASIVTGVNIPSSASFPSIAPLPPNVSRPLVGLIVPPKRRMAKKSTNPVRVPQTPRRYPRDYPRPVITLAQLPLTNKDLGIYQHPSDAILPASSMGTDDPPLPLLPSIGDDTVTHRYPIEQPTPADVLMGRGAMVNYHPGNAFYRKLIALYRLPYAAAAKFDKATLARNLVHYQRLRGARFLTNIGDRWWEVGDERAYKKCSQSLREGMARRLRVQLMSDDDKEEQVDEEEQEEDKAAEKKQVQWQNWRKRPRPE